MTQRLQRARDAVTDVVLSSLSAAGSRSATVAVHTDGHAPTVVDHALVTLLEQVGGDAAGFWEHVRGGWSTPLFVTPTEVWRRLPYGRTLTTEAAKIHPGIRHCLEAHPSEPFTVTDLVTNEAWQGSEIGRTMRGQWGRNFQLMVPVDTGVASSTFWVWVVGRQVVDFGSEDRLVASALQPVLTAVTRYFVQVDRAVARDVRVGSLTPRESAVTRLLLDGHTAGEIAARLAISTRTVHKHVERIYRKLDVHDRPSLVAALREVV